MVTTYQNPIMRGMYPDPSITRVDDTYYMVNSTFEYYPGIALAKSTDLLNWTKLPGVVTTPTQADLRHSKSNEGIFAVCLRYHAGHFYVITTNFAEFKTFLIRGTLSSDKSTINWDQTRVEIDVPGIDPDIYFEADHAYVQFTGYIDDHGTKAIRQVEIDLNTGKILRGPELLTYGTGGRDVEGPHIIKKDDWYYLLVAEGGTGAGHMITMFRSRNLWGPYADKPGINPLFTNRDRANEPLQSIGHADLFQDSQHNWWLTCLGTRPAAVGFLQLTNIGRETLLYPVKWEHDWPQIYTGVPTAEVDLTDFPKHAASLTTPQHLTDFVDDFAADQLNPEWISLRDQVPALKLQPNRLTLVGNQRTLADLGTPAFLGVRQTEQTERFTVTVSPASRVKQGRFGIAMLINVDHFAALVLQADAQGGYTVYRQQKVADISLDTKIGTLSQLPTTLSILNEPAKKTFTATTATNETASFTTDSIQLSNEATAALNTGDIQGLYAVDQAELVVSRVTRTTK